ncbi:VOC family protein [Candidatus Entotheonella palauensis]|uniref:VOC family protein n=1 Tax=Candidatus Entotheonella palauensis TaxID=93172 RepID=UPI000B7ECBBC|nr:VOC family protein [Candidatus Entotheonella palauensis]
MTIHVHAYIAVTDMERGIEFYCRALGLRLRRRLHKDWAELEGASTPIFLLVRDRPADPIHYWTAHLDFLTDDLEAAANQACEAGAVLVREVQERVWGRMANLMDPFDNPFDLIELASGGYDRIDYVDSER